MYTTVFRMQMEGVSYLVFGQVQSIYKDKIGRLHEKCFTMFTKNISFEIRTPKCRSTRKKKAMFLETVTKLKLKC